MNPENPEHPEAHLYEPELESTPEPSLALEPIRPPLIPPPEVRPAVSAEQAKVDAIASLTMTAYGRASELKLTPEEIAGLQKEFPDEAFKAGAAGKENLIYVEHAFLRDRLNEVIGPGQWSIIPRKRWGEDFVIPAYGQKPEVQACRIYIEAMLLIRGCFVAEAVGDMTYYKNNAGQNYGDAVEGAKTAALRRCAKELGIGLQAWKKDWCAGWWQRENEKRRSAQNGPGRSGGSPSPAPSRPAQPAPQREARPAAKTSDVVPKTEPQVEADKDQRFRFLSSLTSMRDKATEYFVKKGWIKDGQQLEDLPNQHIPTTKKVYDSIVAELQAYVDGEQSSPEWKKFLMPWGKNKDVPLGELDKKYLLGLFLNYEIEEEWNGKRKDESVIAADRAFRAALDEAGCRYEWKRDVK